MIYGSVCSGIEAATVAWHPLGWRAAWYSEIEPFPCRLLKHYYPNTPNLGDMLKIHETKVFQNTDIDVLVGGTPCQSFSTAGLRGGLADARGNLALQFCRILAIKRPRWFVWENVPGVFSSFSDETGYKRDPGHYSERTFTESSDFASILAGFSECGYSLSWRVLDAQHFGVPQRRRRVFVVGHLGNDWRPSAAVLFESEGLRRNFAPGRGAGQRITGTTHDGAANGSGIGRSETVAALTATGVGTCGVDDNQAQAGHLVAGFFGSNNTQGPISVASALNAAPTRHDFATETMIVGNEATLPGCHCPMATGQSSTEILENLAPTLNCNHEQPIVVSIIPINEVDGRTGPASADPSTGIGIGQPDDPMFTLQSGKQHGVAVYPINTQVVKYFEPRVGRNDRGGLDDIAAPLKAQSGQTGKGDAAPHVIIYDGAQITSKVNGANPKEGDPAPPLAANSRLWSIMPSNSGKDYNAREVSVTQPITTQQGISNNGGDVVQGKTYIRRLTPTECERLQGFPDGYTDIPKAADSPRYEALGNSMNTDVMHWIGLGIDHFDKIFHHG